MEIVSHFIEMCLNEITGMVRIACGLEGEESGIRYRYIGWATAKIASEWMFTDQSSNCT